MCGSSTTAQQVHPHLRQDRSDRRVRRRVSVAHDKRNMQDSRRISILAFHHSREWAKLQSKSQRARRKAHPADRSISKTTHVNTGPLPAAAAARVHRNHKDATNEAQQTDSKHDIDYILRCIFLPYQAACNITDRMSFRIIMRTTSKH